MRILVLLRWLAFFSFTVLCLAVPLGLIWGSQGLIAGVLVASILAIGMRWNATERIARKLQAKPLTLAEAPIAHGLVREYCRRLRIPTPQLMIIESNGLNAGAFGFSRHAIRLVVTRGLLEKLTRGQLAAVLCRVLCKAQTFEIYNESWLCQFFEVLDKAVLSKKNSMRRPEEPLILHRVLRQAILYPITLFPAYVLKASCDESLLDAQTAKLTQNPLFLAGAYRRMESRADWAPYQAPFSCRHLFLATPPTADPLARAFFAETALNQRVKQIETLLTPERAI